VCVCVCVFAGMYVGGHDERAVALDEVVQHVCMFPYVSVCFRLHVRV
jgi:hypothetical protein